MDIIRSQITQQGRPAWRRLADWRLVIPTETLIVIASIAFSVFYNQAFWHVLFG